VHIHATHDPSAGPEVETPHSFLSLGKPFFRLKSYAIGVFHGLAGSAAVMLLLLPTLPSLWVGLGFLVLFGVGTILSMSAVTLLLGVPFAAAAGFRRLNSAVAGIAGGASVVLGAALMVEITLGAVFVPF
jgi:hypothetical protein